MHGALHLGKSSTPSTFMLCCCSPDVVPLNALAVTSTRAALLVAGGIAASRWAACSAVPPDPGLLSFLDPYGLLIAL